MQDTLNNAAIQGDLDTVISLHEQGISITPKTLQFAKTAGHLHVLQYAYQQGCMWDKWPPRPDPGVLKWLHDNGCGEWGWKDGICNVAARNGRLDVVKYLHENGCELTLTTYFAATRRNCREELLRYLLDNNCPHLHDSADAALDVFFPKYGPKPPPSPPPPPPSCYCNNDDGEMITFMCAVCRETSDY